jgi:hypothetical protein
MTSGVKVYYLPFLPLIDNLVILPTFIGMVPVFREILIRE